MCARQRSWRSLRDWARGEIGGVVGVESEWADDGVSLCGIHKYGDGREVGVGGARITRRVWADGRTTTTGTV